MLANWNSFLITPERAIRIAGDVIVRIGYRHPDDVTWMVVLECNDCGRSVMALANSVRQSEPEGEIRESSWPYSVEAILTAVLRHRVIHHEEVLSGDRPDAGTAG